MASHAQPLSASHKQRAQELLPVVYSELKQLAAARLARLRPGQTLQPTALVHEVYLELVRTSPDQWDNEAHFFAAAAQAMRDILVENVRSKAAEKRGGKLKRIDLDPDLCAAEFLETDEGLLALDDAVRRLESAGGCGAQLVMLRYFAGLSMTRIAAVLDMPLRTLQREWRFARTWLHGELEKALKQERGIAGAS